MDGNHIPACRESAGFQGACLGIEGAVKGAFSAAHRCAEAMEKHRPLHTFAAMWSPERYASQERYEQYCHMAWPAEKLWMQLHILSIVKQNQMM